MTSDTSPTMLDASNEKGRTGMKNIFKRKNKGFNVKPSMHIAYLHILNDHMEVDQKYDLSMFNMDELQEIMEFIEFKANLRDIDNSAEFDAVVDAYKDDDGE